MSRGRVAVRRLVSGGQTGADRAALDAAISLGIPCGGWCPRGRRAEGGPIPADYPMRETPRTSRTPNGPHGTCATPMARSCLPGACRRAEPR